MRSSVQKRKQQRGITLIEVSIALIVAAVVAAAAFLLFSQNLKRQDAQNTTNLVTNVISDLRGKFGKQGGYTGLTAAGAFGSGVLSSTDFNAPTGTATAYVPKNTNYFKSINTVGAAGTPSTATVTVTLNDDNRFCTEVATAMISSGANSVVVSGTTNPVTTPGAASAACAAAGTTTAATVVATLNAES